MNSFGQPSRFDIVSAPERVRVLFQGHELADSDDVLILREEGLPDVLYFPFKDVQTSSLRANHTVRHIEGIGNAQFYTIMRDGHVIEDIAWCYGDPHKDAEGIAGRIAFDPRHVEFQMESAPEDRVLRHVPAHDPPYAEIDPMDRRELPPESSARR